MKMETILTHGLALTLGAIVGFYLPKGVPVPSPTPTAAGVWPIPKPSAGYSAQHFSNIHKNLGPAPFYEPPEYGDAAYPNGSLIFID